MKKRETIFHPHTVTSFDCACGYESNCLEQNGHLEDQRVYYAIRYAKKVNISAREDWGLFTSKLVS